VVPIVRIEYLAGDANWIWRMDVQASEDGRQWTELMRDFDAHKKWGRVALPIFGPVSDRYVQWRVHRGGSPMDVVRCPAEMRVYVASPPAPPPWKEAPVEQGLVRVRAKPPGEPSRACGEWPCGCVPAVADAARTWVMVAGDPPSTMAEASRFGINGSNTKMAPLLRRPGIRWVRFENLKWPMVSPGSAEFRFDGSVGPRGASTMTPFCNATGRPVSTCCRFCS